MGYQINSPHSLNKERCMLEKLSSYNLLNYLVPGVITVLVVSKTTHFNLIQQDIWLGAFFYYFVGMLVSRFGSLIIEPILKRIKTKKGSFIEFANYGDFAKASSTNPKIEVLSEANNLYRSFISSFMCIGLLIVYDHVRTISPVIINIEKPVVILLLIALFLFSYRKQTKYVSDRVKEEIMLNHSKNS